MAGKRARDDGGDGGACKDGHVSKRADTRRYANVQDYLVNNPRANDAKVEAFVPDGAGAELVSKILTSKIVFLRPRHATGAGAMPSSMIIDPDVRAPGSMLPAGGFAVGS
jgi:hypothetical protein